MKKVLALMSMAILAMVVVSCGEKEPDPNPNPGETREYTLSYNNNAVQDGDTVVYTITGEEIEVYFSIQNPTDAAVNMQTKYEALGLTGIDFTGLCAGGSCLPNAISETYTVPANGSYNEFHLAMMLTRALSASTEGLCKLTFGDANTFANSKVVYVKFVAAAK